MIEQQLHNRHANIRRAIPFSYFCKKPAECEVMSFSVHTSHIMTVDFTLESDGGHIRNLIGTSTQKNQIFTKKFGIG